MEKNGCSNEKNIFVISESKSPARTEVRKRAHVIRDFAIAFVSSTAILLSIFLVKLSVCLNASDVGFIKFIIQFLFCLPFSCSHNILGPKGCRILLICRGLTGAISIVACYFSVKLIINFPDAISIRYLSPIATTLIASYILKEKLKSAHWFAIGSSLIGCALIIRPATLLGRYGKEWEAKQMIGIALALIGMCAIALGYYFIKKLADQRVHFSVGVFYFSATGLLLTGSLSTALYLLGFGWEEEAASPTLVVKDVLIALIAGLLKFFGHLSFSLVAAKENTEQLALLRLLDVALAILLDFCTFESVPGWIGLAGIAFVLTAISLVYMRRLFLVKSLTNLTVRFKRNSRKENDSLML